MVHKVGEYNGFNFKRTRGSNPKFIAATGGTPCAGATCGNFKIHTFTGPGTFTVAVSGNACGSGLTQ